MAAERQPRRFLLVGTFLIFFVPIMAAWLLNVFAPNWRPFGTLNHGTLVEPVRQVGVEGLIRPDGGPMEADYLSGHWTVVQLVDGECGPVCLEGLSRSHQVQLALGDDMQRVQLILVLDKTVTPEAATLPPGVTVATADAAWLARFSVSEAQPAESVRLFLVDPQGYLMMRYAADVDQRALLADLERLLKISKIG